jgi:hypothetical protein
MDADRRPLKRTYTKVTFCGEQRSQLGRAAQGGKGLWNSGSAGHFLKRWDAEQCDLRMDWRGSGAARDVLAGE